MRYEQKMSLPSALNYASGLKQNAVPSVSTVYECPPANSAMAYQPGSTLQFDIPCGIRSQYLDCSQTFLRFSVTPTLTGGANVRSSPYDFFRTMNLYSSAGSSQLESVDSYNCLHHVLRDTCSNPDQVITSDTITAGADPTKLRSFMPLATGTAQTFVMPLSSIIGLGSCGESGVYLPLNALTSSLRLELTLASAASALGCAAGTTASSYIINSPVLSLGLITISDIAQQQITSMNPVFSWNSTIWRAFRQHHAQGQMSASVLVPAQFSSVRSLFVAQRESARLEDPLAYSIHDRIRNSLTSYQLKLGSAFVNPRPVDCTGNGVSAFIEMKRVFGGLTSESWPTLCQLSTWNKDTSTTIASGTDPGSFLIGCELQPFSQVGKLLSGTNTRGSNMYLDLSFGAAPVAATLDIFVEADALVTVANGQMNISY